MAMDTHGTHNIRLKFMCQMAELILQGLAGEKYKPPSNSTPKSSVWKPKYYASLNQVSRLGVNILYFVHNNVYGDSVKTGGLLRTNLFQKSCLVVFTSLA